MTRPRKAYLRFLLPVLALGLVASLWRPGTGNQGVALEYRVRPAPGEGFDVVLHASGLGGAHRGFRLLDGWGLLQDQSGHVEGLSATDPSGRPIAVTAETESGTARWHLAGSPREAVLRYRVRSYEPDVSAEASFVDRSRLVILGYSLFLLPLRIDHYAPLDVTVRVEPLPGSSLWSSWPDEGGAYRPGTAHDLWSGVVAGGDFASTRLARGPVTVTVLTEASAPGRTGLTIANRLLPVLGRMVDFFGAPPRETPSPSSRSTAPDPRRRGGA